MAFFRKALARTRGRTLPWGELALGIAILSGVWLRWFATIASLILGFFFILMVRSYAAGLKIDCGCFGPGEALGPKTLLRDGVLLALALAVTIGLFRRGASSLPAPRFSARNDGFFCRH